MARSGLVGVALDASQEEVGKMTVNKKILASQLAGERIGDGLVILPGQGNSLAAESDAGIVLLDAGTARHFPRMIATLRAATDQPLHAIVYSHGHMGYNAGIPLWDDHNAGRGEPPARRIAHRNLLARYERYRETLELQARFAYMQFPSSGPLREKVELLPLYDPGEVFDERMVVVEGRRRIEVLWAPSEVDDALVMWLPDDGLLCAGPVVTGHGIPNIGTPLRTQRFTRRWAETLERLAALGAERLLTEFAGVIEGAKEVDTVLRTTSDALRWLRSEVVRRLNKGFDEAEILADMSYPDDMFGLAWMRPGYGAAEYIVRDLYREETGWWDRNPTTLHPGRPTEVAEAIAGAITDPAAVIARAEQLAGDGQVQLALHVIDLVALGDGQRPEVAEARRLKADLCRRRAAEVEPYVSKALYETSARILEQGQLSWSSIPYDA